MVRMRCRIVEDEEPAAALQKLRSTLEDGAGAGALPAGVTTMLATIHGCKTQA